MSRNSLDYVTEIAAPGTLPAIQTAAILVRDSGQISIAKKKKTKLLSHILTHWIRSLVMRS